MWLWFGIVRTLALVKEGLAFVIQKIAERQAKRADSKPAEPIGPPSPEALAALEAHVAAFSFFGGYVGDRCQEASSLLPESEGARQRCAGVRSGLLLQPRRAA